MSPAAWRHGATVALILWALILAVVLGARTVSVLAVLGYVLVAAALLAWPVSAAATWIGKRRRARAHRRITAWLTDEELTRQREEFERLARKSAAAIADAQADALGRALDRAELYGMHASTAILPAAVDGATYYPPRLVRSPGPHPLDAAGLPVDRAVDASIARHPAGSRRPA